jgi:hypothetical protein
LQCRRGADSEDDFWAGLTGKQFDDLVLVLVGDGFCGGEFLKCAIDGFWEAIGQLLQFFAEDLGDF